MLLKKKTKVAELRESGGKTLEKRTKVHAQRKFAQGSPSFVVISRDRDRENGSGGSTTTAAPASTAYTDPVNEVMPDVCPKTEDFLDFLCFRSFPGVLPASLSYFADPLRHNFLNGVLPSEANHSSSNLASKHESSKDVDAKQLETKLAKQAETKLAKQAETKITKQTETKLTKQAEKKVAKQVLAVVKPKPKKEPPQIKKIMNISKPKLAVGRIHSSFRRTIANSGIMTRRGIKSCSDLQIAKPTKSKVLSNNKTRKPTPLPKRVATRSQLRQSQVESCSSQPSSDESTDSETSSSEDVATVETKPPVKKRKILPNKYTTLPVKKFSSKVQPLKTKTLVPKKEKASSLPVSKNTRQSAVKSFIVTPNDSPSRKVAKESAKASPVTLRRKSLLPESRVSPDKGKMTKASPEKQKITISSSTTNSSTNVSSKITRETAKKLKRQPPNVATSPTRRPSRRTKEAATLFMTLMGQEEDFNSSELEEQIVKLTKEEENSPPKKKIRVTKKAESCPSSPPTIRTRRSAGTSGLSTSPEKRRAEILQEAAKRFTATQSSSSDESSSEEENDSSSSTSSSSEEETPVRSIRTRSFDPTQVAKSPSNVVKKAVEDTRKTRATATAKKTTDSIPTTEVKMPVRLESKKNSKAVSEKADTTTRKRSIPKRTVITPPLSYDLSSLIEAPVFHPTEKEFTDPIEYLEKIRPECERFGICRIVPPTSFKPECQVSDAMRFTAYNQYIHRMFRRRGPNSRILDAIHRHLRENKIKYKPAPCISGVEIDLPGLYQAVEDFGGPGHVLENRENLWPKIADKLKIPRGAQDRMSKLEEIYCKYLLSYAALTKDERNKLLHKVDSQQYRRSADDEEEDECIVKGSSIALNAFYRTSCKTQSVWFPNINNSSATEVAAIDPPQVEAEFWKLVTRREAHVCVHSGNIDSGQAGYGFPCNKTSRHPWNLKVLTNNNGSVLRSLGPVAGCTAPTLHVSMLFSASCWYRDPHGLPWIDYLHTGADKIWYGVSSLQATVLHQAMAKLVPDLVKGEKTVWLPSDTVMVPPTMLADEGVSLSRTVQKSGEFVVVWPRAFTSSLSSGYSISESVYFAPLDWLPIGDDCFKELRLNNEPTVFSLQQLLWNIAHDSRSTFKVLSKILPILQPGIDEEIQLRSSLRNFGVLQWEKLPRATEPNQRGDSKKRRQPSTTDEGDMECEECQASLFFSRAENHNKTDSPVTWCLMHALQNIKSHPRITQHIKVFYVHEEDELHQTLQCIQDSIRTKPVRKTATHQRSTTL